VNVTQQLALCAHEAFDVAQRRKDAKAPRLVQPVLSSLAALAKAGDGKGPNIPVNSANHEHRCVMLATELAHTKLL
jgi:hypothetical protein